MEAASEVLTFEALVALFERLDPDVVVGWDVERGSLKWLIARGEHLPPPPPPPPTPATGAGASSPLPPPLAPPPPLDLARRLSRVPDEPRNEKHGNDEWGAATTSDVHLTGRVVFTLWRIMREELKLCSYTLENVVEKVLHRRIPLVRDNCVLRRGGRVSHFPNPLP